MCMDVAVKAADSWLNRGPDLQRLDSYFEMCVFNHCPQQQEDVKPQCSPYLTQLWLKV